MCSKLPIYLQHHPVIQVGCVTFSVYGLGLVSSPLGVPKVSLRHPAKDGFLLRLSPDLGGVWLFWIHRREVAAVGLSGLGCVTFSVYGLGLVSSPLGVPKVSLRHPAKDGFLLRLSPDLGGVWLFWIHRREVAALGLSGLGCVTFSVYGLGLVSSPLGVPKVSLRHPAKDGFLLRLSPDLGGVWLFWIHRREVAALGLSGLGCVTFSVYGLGLVSSPLGVPKVSLRHAAKDGFLLGLSPDLCLAVLDPWPRGCRYGFVRARLRHVFCLRTGACFFSFRGSKGVTSPPCEGRFFASSEPGFRWCLAVLDPSPRGCCRGFVRARLRHVFCLRTGACFFSFRGSKGVTSAPCEGRFFASSEPGFRWCLAVLRARLRHVFCLRTGACFFSFRGSKGVTSAPCEGRFFASSEPGFRWCLAVLDPSPRGCCRGFVRARLRHVFCLRTGACFFSFRGSKGVTSAPCEGRFFASSEPGFRWCLAVLRARLRHVFCLRTEACFFSFRGSKGVTSAPCEGRFFASSEPGFRWCLAVLDPSPRGCRFGFVGARLRHVFCLRTGAWVFSFRGSKGVTSARCEGRFFAWSEPGFRWWLAVLDPSPRGCRYGFVRARLRHVFCLRTGACFFSFRGSKGVTSAPCEGRFFASSEPGFRWCLAVLDPSPRGCCRGFVRVRLRHVFCLRTGACFFSFRGSKGVTSAPCEGRFFASSEPGFRWCLAVLDPSPRGCCHGFVRARLRHVFCLRTGACFFSFRGSKAVTSAPCEGRFFALSEPGFRWCLAVLDPSPRGCRFGFVRARLRHVFCLRTGACFFSFRGSKGVTSAPCEGRFFASSEPGFRWCLAVLDPSPRGCRFGFVGARLRHVFCLRTGACFFSFRGSKAVTSARCEGRFFAWSEPGFRWCLAVLDPWPRGCRYGFVRARLRHVFCLRTGACFFSFRGSKGVTSAPCEGRFFASSEPGFRWCLAVLDPSPRGCCRGFVRARLRHVFCLRTGACFFSFNGSKGVTSAPCEGRFFASSEPGFRWCLAVLDPSPRGCRFGFVRARLRHVFCLRTGACFFSFRGSKGVTSAPCEGRFFASSEPGFRWCLAVLDPSPRGCRFGFVGARLRHVFCLRTGACFFSFRGSKGVTSARCEGRFFASSEPGFRWCLAVLDPSPRGCRYGFVRARLRHVFCLRTGACFFSFKGSKGMTSPPCAGLFFAAS